MHFITMVIGVFFYRSINILFLLLSFNHYFSIVLIFFWLSQVPLFAEDNRRVPDLARRAFFPLSLQPPSQLPRPGPCLSVTLSPRGLGVPGLLLPPLSVPPPPVLYRGGRPALLTLADRPQVPWLVSGLPVLPLPALHLHTPSPWLLSLCNASLVLGSLSIRDRASVIILERLRTETFIFPGYPPSTSCPCPRSPRSGQKCKFNLSCKRRRPLSCPASISHMSLSASCLRTRGLKTWTRGRAWWPVLSGVCVVAAANGDLVREDGVVSDGF